MQKQTTKATTFASAQAEKVDELKRIVKKQKQHVQTLEQRVRELERQQHALETHMGGLELNPQQRVSDVLLSLC